MTFQKINELRKKVKENSPLIHAITNPISINQCANAALCIGAKPIMAEHPDEVSEITKTSKALLLNLGNITDVRIKSMMISSKTAKENKIPAVIDLVGVACSDLRRNFASELLKYSPAVLKGNYSEILAFYDKSYSASGVDSDFELDVNHIKKAAVFLAKEYGCTVIASGKTDIVTNGTHIAYIKNGSHMLSSVTGTGCVLGELCACFLPFDTAFNASYCACAVLGICGELCETNSGYASYWINVMDKLSSLKDEEVKKFLKLEVLYE